MFLWRLLLLSVVLCLIAIWDYRTYGKDARRWREYVFMYACGCFAAMIGAVNDLYTVSISEDYFVAGKGLEPGDGLSLRAVLLGAQAGFVAGVILAACLLIRLKQAGFRFIAKRVVLIAVAAIATAVLSSLCLPSYLKHADILHRIAWSIEQVDAFTSVWAIHIGLYAGAILSLAVILILGRSTNTPN